MKRLNGPTYPVPQYPTHPVILRKAKTLRGVKRTLTIGAAIREGIHNVYFEVV